MAKRPPSIKQVAEAAGVSTATVSNVFSGKKPVNSKLAERVRKVASDLGYHVNRAASNLRSGQSRVIAVMVPDLSDPFFTYLIAEIEALCEADGFDIVLASSKDNRDVEDRRIDAMLSWRPAGLVVVPCSDQVPEPLIAAKDSLPIVLVDRGAEAVGFDRICPDNEGAGRLAGEHLLELGHRDVLVVASDTAVEGIRDRCRGVTEILRASGVHAGLVEVGPDPVVGKAELDDWVAENPLPSAIFATTDMTTLAVLSCLAGHDVEIGHDVSIVGFDDYPWMSARRTPLTAIRQPIEDMASLAWRTLKARMNNQEPDAPDCDLSCTLTVRASTRRNKDREPPKGDHTRKGAALHSG